MRPAAALFPRWLARFSLSRSVAPRPLSLAISSPGFFFFFFFFFFHPGLAHGAPHHRAGHRQRRGEQRPHHGVALDDREPAGHVQPGRGDGDHAAEPAPPRSAARIAAQAPSELPTSTAPPSEPPPPARPPGSGPAAAAPRRRPAGRPCRTPEGPPRARAARRGPGVEHEPPGVRAVGPPVEKQQRRALSLQLERARLVSGQPQPVFHQGLHCRSALELGRGPGCGQAALKLGGQIAGGDAHLLERVAVAHRDRVVLHRLMVDGHAQGVPISSWRR